MVHVVVVNSALHPASHSLPMEIRAVLPRAGKMWAVVASGGNCGKLSWAVWLEWMVLLSGWWTVSGVMTVVVCDRRLGWTAKKLWLPMK